jgi:hypothetical protein
MAKGAYDTDGIRKIVDGYRAKLAQSGPARGLPSR